MMLFSGRNMALASCFALVAAPVTAATLEPITVADVTRVDELGFACIEEADLEMAYAATGKKDGLLPRTCLPEPCAELIAPDELAQQIGRDPTETEWAEYVARYADLCVAETAGVWPEEEVFTNASAPVTDDTFWNGLAGVPLNSGVGSDVIAGLPGGAGSFTPGIIVPIAGGIPGLSGGGNAGIPGNPGVPVIPGIPPIFGGGGDGDDGNDGDDGDDGEPGLPGLPPDVPGTLPPPLTPVPLPASMLLLMGALGITWGTRQVSGLRRSGR